MGAHFPRFVADLAITVDVDVGYLAKAKDIPTGSETRNARVGSNWRLKHGTSRLLIFRDSC